MELKLINEQGEQAATVEASDTLFGRTYNEALVHQVVVAYQANARAGNRAQKDRSAVRHSTKKPWRQKGTGRARQGSTRAQHWRGRGGGLRPLPRAGAPSWRGPRESWPGRRFSISLRPRSVAAWRTPSSTAWGLARGSRRPEAVLS